MEDLSGTKVKGYELVEKIGSGSFGAVYRARQTLIDREVAIKVILPEHANQPEFIRGFDTEAQLVAQLEHFHIVPLYDYWREPDGAYLVMRLIKGGNLETSLQAGAWDLEKIAILGDQISSALMTSHQFGVVHRDLKPANILLDDEGNAYLTDFGIAKSLTSTKEAPQSDELHKNSVAATQTDGLKGTPAYMTPEQVQSRPVTPQTDIYSMGVVLYEMLTGAHPFSDTPLRIMFTKHLTEPMPSILEQLPDLPVELDEVIQS
jgi:serine/threonine-protein kinase